MRKDEFLSQVSHEVRTPMTSIRSFSDILLNSPDLEDAQKQRFLRIIQNESLRLTRLLDGFLDLERDRERRARLGTSAFRSGDRPRSGDGELRGARTCGRA